MNNQSSGEEFAKSREDFEASESKTTGKKLETVAWGSFFIWIGVVFLLDLGFPVGLLGVGIITLSTQAVRNYFKLKLEGFWIIAGLLFVIGGVWEMLKIDIDLVPILIIIAGLVIIISVIRTKQK